MIGGRVLPDYALVELFAGFEYPMTQISSPIRLYDIDSNRMERSVEGAPLPPKARTLPPVKIGAI